MAEVTITFKDEDDGGVDIAFHFDPPIDEKYTTPAQTIVAEIINFLTMIGPDDGGLELLEKK